MSQQQSKIVSETAERERSTSLREIPQDYSSESREKENNEGSLEDLELQRTKSQNGQLQIKPSPLFRNMTTYEDASQLEAPVNTIRSNSTQIRVTFFPTIGNYDRNQEQLFDRDTLTLNKHTSQDGESHLEEHMQFLGSIQFTQFQRWLLLSFTIVLNSLVPVWMVWGLKCERITRSGWRYFVSGLLLIPFVMSQQRATTNQQDKFRALFQPHILKKIYIRSLNNCIWVLFGVFSARLTSSSHTFCFLRLKFFATTLLKLYRNQECHQGQIGGVLLVSVGMFMMLWDSAFLPVTQIPAVKFLRNRWWQRLCGDLLAIIGCLALMKLESKYELPKGPRFSVLFLYNMCVAINLVVFGYYFGGNQFTFDPKYGVFGLFTSANFVDIFYVSVMLGLNLIIANVLVNQIFSLFFRNMASCFQIVLTNTFNHIFQLQKLYSGTTTLGLCFIVPGNMMLVGGQGTLQKLQMRINSQIYKSQKVLIGSDRPKTEIILTQVSSPTKDKITMRSVQSLKVIKQQQGEATSNHQQLSTHANPTPKQQ